MGTEKFEADPFESERINADTLFKKGAYDEAKQAYQSILSRDPNNSKALNNLGALHEHNREAHQARSLYRKACVLAKPGSVQRNVFLNNFARISISTADWHSAIWAYETMIESEIDIGYETAVMYLKTLEKLMLGNSQYSTTKCLEKLLRIKDIDSQAVADLYFQQVSNDNDLRYNGSTIFGTIKSLLDKYPLALSLMDQHIIANPRIELLLDDFCEAIRTRNTNTEISDECKCILAATAKQNLLSGNIRFECDRHNCHLESKNRPINHTKNSRALDLTARGRLSSYRIPRRIKEFYELYPYPLWTSTPLHTISKIDQYFTQTGINTRTVSNGKDTILVAGCGTGRHAIQLALTFPESQIIGIDISLSSLLYARQKKNECNIKNVRFIQCSIFDIGKLGLKFKIIECIGVLHHLKQPTRALKLLVSVLAHGGIVKLGLYSRSARQPLVHLKRECARAKIDYIPENLQAIRKLALKLSPDSIKPLINSRDFYSLEGCMDLLFNPVEQQFTIGGILNIVTTLKLDFAGFDCTHINGKPPFASFGDFTDPKPFFEKWHSFELENPSTFSQMYLFWIRPGKAHENHQLQHGA